MSGPGSSPRDERSALIAGLAAFSFWGIVPVYWKLLVPVPVTEILAHRFLWTALFLIVWLTWQQRWAEVQAVLRSRRALIFCLSSGVAIALNWGVFIWAVNIGRVIETSLGYFITPLVNVLLGALFLRERLTRWQLIAVSLAAGGVLYLTFGYGRFPWIALVLAASFGLYGLLRKQSRTAPIPGLFIETLLLVPVALVWLAFLSGSGRLFFGGAHPGLSAILISTGLVTGLPLVWFGHAARHLRLTTIGFFQYIAPSCTFLLGVFLYHEPFTTGHLVTFGLIWLALALFTWDALAAWRSRARSRADALLAERPV